jgi:hypothetical protein
MKIQDAPSATRRCVLSLSLILSLTACSAKTQTTTANATTANLSTPTQMPQKNLTRAEDAGDPVPVETRLTELFGFCKSDDPETAAPYFVYRGPDKAREWKDTMRADDPLEKGAVRELCKRVKGYLEESQSYSFGAVEVRREREGEWHALEVSFRKGDETRKVTFAFLPVKGQFSVGDIDD